MAALTAVLVVLVVVAVLYGIADRFGVPYPSLLVIGGLVLALLPGRPDIALDPQLVLVVFLPPLLFSAAFETSLRELRRYIAPIVRLAIGLVFFTAVLVALALGLAIPGLGWPVAFTFGAIVAPTDALAATAVFRRVGVPRVVRTLIEGESLLNDATALVAYRVAVAAVVTGTFGIADLVTGMGVAAIGGVLVGLVVGWLAIEILRRFNNPPVEVLLSLVVAYAAYLPADELGLSGVLATVTAGLMVGRRLGTILSPDTRLLWLSTWRMVGFVVNGSLFVLIGLQLPGIVAGLGNRRLIDVVGLALLTIAVLVVARFAWVYAASLLPNSPRREVARVDRRLASRYTFVVGWAGLRGAVSLAAGLALPAGFPERNLLLFLTFAVIVFTLVGQGLSLPVLLQRTRWDGVELDGDEGTLAREAAYTAGLAEIERIRPNWPGHQPLLDRLELGLHDRERHLATDDPEETAERRQERVEHEVIQRGVIEAQRRAVIELRDSRKISDETLREIERELDLEEIRKEA